MLINDCGWKGGDSVEELCSTKKNERTHLTPTGLFMEGVITH